MSLSETMAHARLARLRVCIGLSVFVCAAYFFGGAASNQNARLAAVYAFVEPGTADTGTFRIDRFMQVGGRPLTLDWAYYDGHYYANKAPGTIWLGVLVYRVLLLVEDLLGLSFEAPFVVLANAYLINVFVSVLPLAVASLSIFELCLALGSTAAGATWVALATSLGTLWFPYSTQLWGHTTAAAFTAMALVQVQRATPRAAALAGSLAGLAVCTDYLAILGAFAVSAWLASLRPRLLPFLLLGALPMVLALCAYHTICFGGPLVTASQMSNPKFLEHGQVLGMFGRVSGAALWGITFGLRRGLFVQCPVLLLSLVGVARWIRRSPRDPLAYVCLVAALGYFAANASFNGWHGGATVGARYLICALPFLGLCLRELPATRWMWIIAVPLLALSFFNMLQIAAVNPLAPDELDNPLYGYTYRLFFDGVLAPYPFSVRTLALSPEWPMLREFCMWNLGELLGLRGLWSLLPLVLCLLSLGAACLVVTRSSVKTASEGARQV